MFAAHHGFGHDGHFAAPHAFGHGFAAHDAHFAAPHFDMHHQARFAAPDFHAANMHGLHEFADAGALAIDHSNGEHPYLFDGGHFAAPNWGHGHAEMAWGHDLGHQLGHLDSHHASFFGHGDAPHDFHGDAFHGDFHGFHGAAPFHNAHFGHGAAHGFGHGFAHGAHHPYSGLVNFSANTDKAQKGIADIAGIAGGITKFIGDMGGQQ